MGDTQEVKALRKSGKVAEARELGERLLQERPTDIWVARALGWVYWEQLKAPVAAIEAAIKANHPAPPKADAAIGSLLHDYANLWKQIPEDAHRDIPGMLHSHMIRQLGRVGKHVKSFLGFMKWAGPDCFQAEDFVPFQADGKTFPSLAVKAALQCAAWLKSRPDEQERYAAFVESMLKVALERGQDQDKVWIQWRMALILRQRGEVLQAAQTIAPILKQKRSEFWVWSEAARIYQDDQPELGLACYCQALCCGAEPKFVGKTHTELALLLARQGETGWASKEIATAAKIYDQEGWGHSRDLQDCLSESWFDPSTPGIDAPSLRREHAEEALSLCFDRVVLTDATFVGMEDHPHGKKPRPKFIAWIDGESVMIRARRASRSITKANPGLPVRLTIGVDDEKRDVIEAHPRPEGSPWDQLSSGQGVVTRIDEERGSVQVFLGYQNSCWVPIGVGSNLLPQFEAGMGMALWFIPNKKSGKPLVMHWEPRTVEEHPDIRLDFGLLELKRSGVAFVEDTFIPAHLLTPELEGQLVDVVAVRDLDKKKNRPGWKAITVKLSSVEGAENRLGDQLAGEVE